MSNKTHKHKHSKKHKYSKKYKHKTRKHYKRLPNRNPRYINEISQIIFVNSPEKMPPLADSVSIIEQNKGPTSYSPTVNKELVMLQSIERENVHNCNNEKAFELKEPLQIGIPGKIFGKRCPSIKN